MTDTNATQTWRDFADRLTPQQIAELEYCEAEQLPPGIYSPDGAVRVAQAHVRTNEAQARFAGIPVPPDAIDTPSAWMDIDGHRWWRIYTAHRQVLDFPRPDDPNHDGTVVIEVVGHQYDDGGIERYVRLEGGGMDELTAGQAMEVAAALVAAADLFDGASE